MTEAVERLGNLQGFLNAWDDPGDWQNCREVPLRSTAYGNINSTGDAGDYSGHALTQWQRQFDVSIEPGVLPLVHAMVDGWRWITFTSCEGHLYPDGRLSAVPRHVGLLPRNTSEEAHIVDTLRRARAAAGDTDVPIYVTCRPVEDPTAGARTGNAVFLTFGAPTDDAVARRVDEATRRFVTDLAGLPDRIDYRALRRALEAEGRDCDARTRDSGHRGRVERLGLRLAQDTDADVTVVRLFSVFHECGRSGDESADLITRLLPGFCAVHPHRARLLRDACARVGDDVVSDDATIGTCWDAARLDLTNGEVPAPRRLSTEVSSFLTSDAVYHVSTEFGIEVFEPRAYWHVDWSVSGSVADGVPDAGTTFECVYAASAEDVPFYLCPPRISRVCVDIGRAHGKADLVRRLLHGESARRVMIFDSRDGDALADHECQIYRFPRSAFELFPNGEYGASRAVVPEAAFACTDWVGALNGFDYQVMLLDDLERLVRTLLREGIPFESEGFEHVVLEHRGGVDVVETPAVRLWSAVSAVRELNPDELRDSDVLCSIIRRAGLTYDERFACGPEAAHLVPPPGGLYQNPRQLADLLVYLGHLDIGSTVEVGAGAGWTTVVTAAYLERFNPGVRCLGVDVEDVFAVDRSILDRVPCELRQGTSADLISTRFDFCLIDGDHSYDAVMADFTNVGRHATLCAFHDIHDRWCPGVRRAWLELRDRFPHREFRGDVAHVDHMGIGVLDLRGAPSTDGNDATTETCETFSTRGEIDGR